MMKKTTWLIIAILMMWIGADAQNSITIDGVTMEGRAAGNGWIFEGEEDTILAFKKEDYSEVMEKVQKLRSEVKRLEDEVAAREKYIATVDDYRNEAENLIGLQQQMIGKADSLYTGYSSLYDDLKSVYGMTDISVMAGTGAFRYSPDGWKPLFNLGVEYKQFQGSYLFGKNFNGISLQYRIWSF
ncbi:MAG: hypothetical protein ACOC90_09015 [Bacteroidota bacterium]